MLKYFYCYAYVFLLLCLCIFIVMLMYKYNMQGSVCHCIGMSDCYVLLIKATVMIILIIYKHRKFMMAIHSRISVGIAVWTFPFQMYILTHDIYVSVHHDIIYENDQQDATV
jgi:hypothetical protein